MPIASPSPITVALAALVLLLASGTPAAQPMAGSAAALRAAMPAEKDGAAQREAGWTVASTQDDGAVSGSLQGVVARGFDDIATALGSAQAWCEVLILDPNIHRCQVRAASGAASQPRVEVAFGSPPSPLVLVLSRTASSDYLRVTLTARDGPLGTHDYAMALEAAPLAEGRSVVRLAFAQRFGIAGRLAMNAYFTTVARGKVGFTVVARDAAGGPVRVGDLRGAVERNLVRQWLALGTYLDARAGAPADLAQRRVDAWLAGTARYPLQLAEEDGYRARKVPEVRSQLAGD